ncbi:MAG: VCBS domain-containing protein, partial [Alphaproteobacteria bacterium]
GETSVTQTITITINGTNDAPIVEAATNTMDEDTASVTGTLTTTDVDDTSFTYAVSSATNESGKYGSVTIDSDGNYSYTLDNSKVQYLDTGESVTDTITIIVSDGETSVTQTITITINGTNDAPIVEAATNTMDEDTASVTGTLTTTDVDDTSFTYTVSTATNESGKYGSVTIDSDGNYSYTLDNSKVQYLDMGDSVTDTITIIVSDGETSVTQTITITINGTNDAPTIDAGAVTTGTIAENVDAPRKITGDLAFTDVDTNDNLTYTIHGPTGVEGTSGAFGTLSYDADTGKWTYTLDSRDTNAELKALDPGETATDTFTIKVTDDDGVSVEQEITITIKGTNEAPIIDEEASRNSIAFVGAGDITDIVNTDDAEPESGSIIINERGEYNPITGSIKASDSNIDDGDEYTQTLTYKIVSLEQLDQHGEETLTTINNTTFTNDYGTLTLSADGKWVFTPDTDSLAFQWLSENEELVLTFNIGVSDGIDTTTTQVTVTLKGTSSTDLNFVHEYGASDLLEWVEYDYNPKDDITTDDAKITRLELMTGSAATGWSLSRNMDDIKVSQNLTNFLSQAGSYSTYWVLTKAAEGGGYYQVVITDTGFAFYTGSADLGPNEELYLPIKAVVSGDGQNLVMDGTYITGSDANTTTKPLENDLMSDGSVTNDDVVDYQTYSTKDTSSADQGTGLSSYDLSSTAIGAKNGGRTYLHVFGSGVGNGEANTINIATSHAISVTGENSYLFMDVHGDNSLITSAYRNDIINIGDGNVGLGTLGADIRVQGGNIAGENLRFDHINFGNWSWAGNRNNITLVGGDIKDFASETDIDAYITVGNQIMSAGITNFDIAAENIGSNKDSRGSYYSQYATAYNVKVGNISVTGGKLNMNVAADNIGDINGNQNYNNKIIFGAFLTSGSAEATLNIAGKNIGDINGDVDGRSFLELEGFTSSGSSTSTINISGGNIGNLTETVPSSQYNSIKINNVSTANNAVMNMIVAGRTIGDVTASGMVHDAHSLLHIDKIDVTGGTLNLAVYGDYAGDVFGTGNAGYQNSVHLNNINVAAGALLNLDVTSGSKSLNGLSDGGYEYGSGQITYLGLSNVAGTADIVMTASTIGDVTDAAQIHGGYMAIGANATSDSTTSLGAWSDIVVTGSLSLLATNVGGTATNANFIAGYFTSYYMMGNVDTTAMQGGEGIDIYGSATTLVNSNSGGVIVNNGGGYGLTGGVWNTGHNTDIEIALDAHTMIDSDDRYGDNLTMTIANSIIGAGITVSGDAFVMSGDSGGFNSDIINLSGASSTTQNIIYGDTREVTGSGTIILGGDSITGGAGNDIIYTDFKDDSGFSGTYSVYGADTVYARDGDDKVYAGFGTETLNGGNGIDTLYVQGLESDYSQSPSSSPIQDFIMSGMVDGIANTMVIYQFEHIIFEDGAQYDWSGSSWIPHV